MVRIGLAGLMGWLGMMGVEAHPMMAQEVNYPLVAGFDRFYSEQDPEDYLAEGGKLLLNELNCVGCHQPGKSWQAWFPGVRGPDLAGVGSRVRDEAVLRLLIRNPRFLKRATAMPSLFAASDRDEDELEALFHYMLSLRDEKAQPMLLGEVEKGQRLYHAVGCVACHAPDVEYVPPGWPLDRELERPGMASQPIRWAGHWTADFVTRFLMEPERYRPGGRMPSLGLSEEEAAHITAYLHDGVEGGADDLKEWEAEPELATVGQRLFVTKGCAVCHEVAGVRFEGQGSRLGLDALRSLEAGCLADLPQPGGVPHFFLSELQKTALRGALERMGGWGEADGVREAEGEGVLVRMDCYACHSFRGKGGPELAREPFFGALDPRAEDRESWLPPPLEQPGKGTRSEARRTGMCEGVWVPGKTDR